MATNESIIVIKRIKKGGEGHHGGAWKVAYADFVTAMMAFFLLLWLLSSTSDAQKEGIAEYFTPDQAKSGENNDGAGADIFTPTIGLKDQKGIGFEGGVKPREEDTRKTDLTPPGIVIGQVPQGPIPKDPKKEADVEGQEDSKLFEKAEDTIKKALEEDPNLREFKDNVVLEQTPEGLKIKLVDTDKHPMFSPGSVELSEFGKIIMRKMLPIIRVMPNYISLTGHTDTSTSSRVGYTNWELSADRANAARRFLLSINMEPERVMKVVGMADKDLLLVDDPTAPRNRRIEIILLRGSHLNISGNRQTRDLLTIPTVTTAPRSAPASARKPLSEAPAPRTNEGTIYEPTLPPIGRSGEDIKPLDVPAGSAEGAGKRNLPIPAGMLKQTQ